MFKFKRRLSVTAAASSIDIPKIQLEQVSKHYFAVKNNPCTVTYTIENETFTLDLTVGANLLEMRAIEALSFTSAAGAVVAYVGG